MSWKVSPKAKKCFISKSISIEEIRNNKNNEIKILNNIQEVSINDNIHLDTILKAYIYWNTNPTIFVDTTPYKIKILKLSRNSVELLQICVKINYKSNGKECFNIINKRKVLIQFL